jgi:hypothetical protein
VGESGGNEKSATFLSPTAVRTPRFRHFWRFSIDQNCFSIDQKRPPWVVLAILNGGNVPSTTWNVRFCAENRVSATFCEFHHFFRHFFHHFLNRPPPSVR